MMGYTMGLGGAAALIDATCAWWLDQSMAKFVALAKIFCKHKYTTIAGHVNKATQDGRLVATQTKGFLPHDQIWQWAFDYTFTVPTGGFTPPPGAGVFIMEKPEGIRKRRRTYTRHSGATITRKGYVSEAFRQTFTKPNLELLGAPIAQLVAGAVTQHIAAAARAQGFNVIIT